MSKNNWVAGIFIFLFLILNTGISCAQTEITGYVKDLQSLEPVPGANVFIEDSKRGSPTNGSGYFQFLSQNLEVEKLRISHVGYRDTVVVVSIKNRLPLIVLLEPDSILIASIVVTATRTQNLLQDIPQRVNLLSETQIREYPATNADNLLKMIPGVVVNRSWGIFSRNSSVTMRGMPGSARSLILLDGVPLNKTAGGTVNWHLINPEEIERIEVVKGPGSALYGNNAMGGVINLISRKQEKKPGGDLKIGYGTYNTFSGQLNLNGNKINHSKGIYWKLSGFYRKGDGYILAPPEERDSTSSKASLLEGNATGLIGYRFGSESKLELEYRFYKDKRGQGTQVFEKDGSLESFTNNNFRLNYRGYMNRIELNINAFVFNENFVRQQESVNGSGEYKLTDVNTYKLDMGLWMTMSRKIRQYHKITAGLDLKHGSLDNQEIYRTSTDEIYTDGMLMFSAFFVQDELSMLNNRLNVIAGLRFDYAKYYNGHLNVIHPTRITGFPGYLKESYPESNWLQISPKFAARYLLTDDLTTYLSASTGFMPPKLDDLSGSRKIRRGFKIANPDLKPEVISSIEWGLDWSFRNKLVVKPALYYSLGNDFQYLVGTGDFIDSGSQDPIPVYQRQNVSKVQVLGAELGLEYRIRNNLKLTGSYAFNSSTILAYESSGDLDLDGKYLNEVPKNLVFLALSWNNRIINLFIDYTFTDEQWYDEGNTEIIDRYSVVNLRLSRNLFKNLHASIIVQDLLDEQFIDRKGYLSPGRFIMFEIKYSIN